MASALKPGLILLGNSGVGKSFLANRLLNDDEAFESKFSARSVTRHTEWKDMTTAIGKYIYSVANIPGLVEANQKLIDENRHEIMKAFEQCPFAIVLFVFGHKNGRIPDEDLVAFMRINDAYEFTLESLLLIVNGIPSNRPDDYEEKTAQLLHELTHVNKTHIYFIENTTLEKSKRDIHNRLYEAIAKCEPTYHKKKQDIELVADEISRLKLESKQRQDKLLAQENEYSNKKQKFNLTPDATLELYQPPPPPPPQKFLPTTIKTKPDITDDNRPFDDMMKAIQSEHDQNMEELKKMQHDPNRDAIIQLTQQLAMGNQRNKELMDQVSSSPQVIVVCKEQRKNIFQTIGKGIINIVRGEDQSHEPRHHETSSHGNNHHTVTPRGSNRHRQNPNNN
jgi:adenylate kinase family enzyme